MNTARLLFALTGLLLLAGCSTMRNIAPAEQIISLPPENQTNTTEIGETILTKGRVLTYNTITLKHEVKGEASMAPDIRIPAQQLVAMKEDKDWTYYYAKQLYQWTVFGEKPAPGGIKLSKSNPLQALLFVPYLDKPYIPNPGTIYFDYGTRTELHETGFKQELIYNGKSGSAVKFLYRELANDMMRAPFSQELVYDMDESNVIGIKGARVKVVKATNTNLTYQVLSNFTGL